MKKHLLFLCCLVMAALTLPSCSSDDGEGGTVIPPGGQGGQGGTGSTSYESLIIGEWGLANEEYALHNGEMSTGGMYQDENETYWTFGSNGYFKVSNVRWSEEYQLQGNKLNIIDGQYIDSYTILKLDRDSLVVKYTTTEENHADFAYAILHMKRLTPYFDGSEEREGGATGNPGLFGGEWKETKEEFYQSENQLSFSSSNPKTVWLMDGSGGFFCIDNPDGSTSMNGGGTWTRKGGSLTIATTDIYEPQWTVLRLSADSFVVTDMYICDFSYYSVCSFKRLSTASEIEEAKKQFVGKWHLDDGDSRADESYWYFAPDGKLYVGNGDFVSSSNNYCQGYWSYAPQTNILATTIHYDDLPEGVLPDSHYNSVSYMWKVTSLPRNGYWQGEALYTVSGRHEKEVNFAMVD